MKLTKKIFIEGTITAKTGLHIGSKDLGLSIGNTDNTVLRNPVTQQPYIPGSSLRGKIRSLVERFEGCIDPVNMGEVKNGPYISDPKHYICKVFGVPAEKASAYGTPPSRLIVRDGHLTADGLKTLKNAKNTDMPFTEVKTEVVIDRVTSAANPRQLERVPAGAQFELKMVLNIWDIDTPKDEEDFLKAVFNGLELLEDDYLGGHGSRGSGQVKVTITALAEKEIEHYKTEAAARAHRHPIPDKLQATKSEAASESH
jgi:CRISPR-associated protein Csm3